MRHSALILVFLFFSAFAFSQKSAVYSGKLFTYHLYFHVDSNNDANTDSIVIYGKTTAKKVQTLKPEGNAIPCEKEELMDDSFIIADANFDGYEDILLLQFLPANPNLPYYCWLYNPDRKQFELSSLFEDITSPDFDSVNHTIGSSWMGGCCDHGHNTYKYMNGSPTLIEQSEIISDPESGSDTLITRKLVHGKLKEISRKVEKSDDQK